MPGDGASSLPSSSGGDEGGPPPFVFPPLTLPDSGGSSSSDDGGPNACTAKLCIDPVFDCPLQGCFNGCTNFHCL